MSSEAVTISRLKKRADFIKARNGARSHERAFVLQLSKRSTTEEPGEIENILRVGFTVTKKIGNAVLRNRIKRRLREALRMAEIPTTVSGFDAVFIARGEAALMPFKDLILQMNHAFLQDCKQHGRFSRKTDINKNKHHVANSSSTGQKRRKK